MHPIGCVVGERSKGVEVRKVLNDKDDSRETIIDYSIKIDEEITKKRKEFGLPVYEGE